MTKDTFLLYEWERNWENEKERERHTKYKGKLRRKERDERNKRIFLSLSQQQTFFLFFLQNLSAFLGARKIWGNSAYLRKFLFSQLQKGPPKSLNFFLPLKKQKEMEEKKKKVPLLGVGRGRERSFYFLSLSFLPISLYISLSLSFLLIFSISLPPIKEKGV